MIAQKLFFVCFILFAFIFSCKTPIKDRNINTSKIIDTTLKIKYGNPVSKIEEKKWDSVRYFKDIIYTTNVGIHPLHNDSLLYPYTAICYKKELIKLSAYFSVSEEYHTFLIKENNIWKTTVDSFYVRDADYYNYYISYFLKDASMLRICYQLTPNISVTSVSKITSIETNCILEKWYSFSFTRNIGIKTLFRFNELELKKLCADSGSSKDIIENKIKYSIYNYSSYDGTNSNNKIKLSVEKYNSYFLNDLYSELKEDKSITNNVKKGLIKIIETSIFNKPNTK